MKKKILFFNLIAALIIGGCSNADVNNVMNSISSGIETGIDSAVGMIEKLKGDTPSTIKLPVPLGNTFKFQNYKMDLKYIENTGIEVSLNGKVQNNTGKVLLVTTEFPVYDLNGNTVSRGYLKNYIGKNSTGEIYGTYSQYKFKKNLRILPEKVITRVYSNGMLIASTHKETIKKSVSRPVEKQTVIQKTAEEIKPAENNQNTRQTRQSIKK